MKPTITVSFTLFLVLSLVSVAISRAPIKVHAVNISCFFVSLVAGTLLAEFRVGRLPRYAIWLLLGVFGLFIWDVLSALVIVKSQIFMGWYILYPLSLVGLVVLQLFALAVGNLQLFNKFR